MEHPIEMDDDWGYPHFGTPPVFSWRDALSFRGFQKLEVNSGPIPQDPQVDSSGSQMIMDEEENFRDTPPTDHLGISHRTSPVIYGGTTPLQATSLPQTVRQSGAFQSGVPPRHHHPSS